MNAQVLYSEFGGYARHRLDPADPSDCGGPARTAREIDAAVGRRPLKELTAHDLLDYFYAAIEHVGSAEDFKHFLPRILELGAESNGRAFSGFAKVLASKLELAGVGQWPAGERVAVREFVAANPEAFRAAENDLSVLLAEPLPPN